MLSEDNIPHVSADIILLEKDLMVLEQGVFSGRETFGNIIKYIKMTASSNFCNMLCYCLLTQLIKMWYIRRFGEWL